MKTNLLYSIFLLGVAVFMGQTARPHQSKASAAGSSCNVVFQPPTPQPYPFIRGWRGIPGRPDHFEHKYVPKGQGLGCIAFAQYTDIDPECVLSYQNGGQYTLGSHEAMSSPTGDVVTMANCTGTGWACCSAQIGGMESIKKNDPLVKIIKPEDAGGEKKK